MILAIEILSLSVAFGFGFVTSLAMLGYVIRWVVSIFSNIH